MNAGKLLVDTAKQCREAEIEKAIDKVKLGMIPAKRRTRLDRWYRKMWYINQWRNRDVRGLATKTDLSPA